ncbi:MAG: periplasmic heavy metal sensor [candidate division WOR-3 bacterium]|nr:periplasmic heavy metal sensor [candidate division WOR-3 bacterium]
MRQVSALVIVLALAAGLAVAQPMSGYGQQQMPMGGMMGQGMMGQGTYTAQQNPWGLTSEQMAQMQAQQAGNMRLIDSLNSQLAMKQVELNGLWGADKIDEKKITARMNEINDLNARIQMAQTNSAIAMYNILTPQQRGMMRWSWGGMMGGMMPNMMQYCPMMNGMMNGYPTTGRGMMGMGMMGGCPMMGGYGWH